jgi:hypothetical protein
LTEGENFADGKETFIVMGVRTQFAAENPVRLTKLHASMLLMLVWHDNLYIDSNCDKKGSSLCTHVSALDLCASTTLLNR